MVRSPRFSLRAVRCSHHTQAEAWTTNDKLKDTGRQGPQTTLSAFSLVELLVVIGIIALLISLLLPALAHMQERSRQLQCQTNLRNLFQAGQMHALDHNGFLPIGGWHWDPAGGIVNPHGLRDDRTTRYVYYNDSGERRPVPVTVALALSLNVKVPLDSRQSLEAEMQKPQFRKYFSCPSQEVPLQGLTQKSSEPWQAPREWSSYVFNEAIIGLRDKTVTADSPMGKMTRIKRPTIVMFAMDGRPRDQENDNWLMVPEKTPDDTLLDFQLMVTAPNTGFGKQLLDYLRHRYRANIVFMDGHVESIPMTQEGLSAVGVSRGIYN